jgi:hypothetical protein
MEYSFFQAMHISGKIPETPVIGTLKIFGETTEGSLKYKIRKLPGYTVENCNEAPIEILNGQTNQLSGDLIGNLQNVGKLHGINPNRKHNVINSNRRGRQLRFVHYQLFQ